MLDYVTDGNDDVGEIEERADDDLAVWGTDEMRFVG